MKIETVRVTRSSRNRIAASVILAAGLACLFAAQSATAAPTKPVAVRLELERSVLAAGARQRAMLKITFSAPALEATRERTPINLAVVLDRSGSMGGEKLEKAKEAAITALRRLGPEDIFSMVVYDDRVDTIVPAQSARNTEWIEGRIREIRSGNTTALFGGVSQGAAELRKRLADRSVNRVILLSDGLANVGPSSPEDLARLGAALAKEGIAVTTVGVGMDYNEDLMTRLSQAGDGNTYFVESSDDLPRIFSAELGDALNVAARTVTIELSCANGIRPLRLIGREGRIRGNVVELTLNQLYGGQEKYALVEVEIPAGKPGEVLEVASVDLAYENPLTRGRHKASARGSVRFSDEIAEVETSVNVPVQRAVVVNISAEARDRAIDQADKGKLKEAAKELRESAGYLKKAAMELRDESLRRKAEETEALVNDMEQQGALSTRSRKSMRTDSYQERNQQLNK